MMMASYKNCRLNNIGQAKFNQENHLYSYLELVDSDSNIAMISNCLVSNKVDASIKAGAYGDFYFIPMPVRYLGLQGTAEILIATNVDGFKRADFVDALAFYKAAKFSILRWYLSDWRTLYGFFKAQIIWIPYISLPVLFAVKLFLNSRLKPLFHVIKTAKAQLKSDGFNIP